MKDCNDCPYLNITEAEQNLMKSTGKRPAQHICTKYNKRVFHRACTQDHNPYLYPCDECLEDGDDHECGNNSDEPKFKSLL